MLSAGPSLLGTPEGGLNFDITFTGIDASVMRFTYREFTSNDMARPAFFQDLTYPLSSRQIRFRDIQIEIASVTAEGVTYAVIADNLVEDQAPSRAPIPSPAPK